MINPRIVSIIPADSALAVAIQDATETTSTVNPARITTAVQKMRPEWSINKRRVKRLLRSINNDAWKAAVSPTFNASSLARDEPTGVKSGRDAATPSATAATSSAGSASSTLFEKRQSARKKAASKKSTSAATIIASAASKSGAPSALSAQEERREEDGGGISVVGNACDTAPASPGSPTSVAAEREICVADGVAEDMLVTRSRVAAAPSPREGAVAQAGVGAEAEQDTGGNEDTAELAEDALGDSLRLEPDFELEAASLEGLKADLGLPTAVDDGDSDSGAEAFKHGKGWEGGEGAVGGDDAGTGGRAEDLGFEMIDRAEAFVASVAPDGAAVSLGTAGSRGGKVRKGWSWSWSRS